MKKILFVASEAMPFAATGGLGDVIGSLPTALAAGGKCDVRVILPLYGQIKDEWRALMQEEAVFELSLSWRRIYCGVKSLKKDGVTYYFVDNEYYFKRATLYGSYDDGERFAYFSMAALSLLERVGFYPDVLHAHDWQAALSVIYLRELFSKRPEYAAIRSVFTIHNIEYQGKYDKAILGDVFALPQESEGVVEYDGCINLMKGAIECADLVSTVSPRYAREIQSPEYAHGLAPVLCRHAGKLTGILNGIDYVYYDPKEDRAITSNFTWRSLPKKAANKTALQREIGLPEDENIPMLAIISRLATHKGLDLVREIAYNLLETQNIQLVVLGMGESVYEEFFRSLEACFPQKLRALITYDRDLSKRIYAASDIFIMPSKSEPCGLSQMIASRYGAIPVTRETGGLYDSIKGYYVKGGKVMGNGFTFANYRADELYDRILAALSVWSDEEARTALVRKIMRTDFSWGVSAEQYQAMYERLVP